MPHTTIFATIEKELDLFTALYDTLHIQQQNILNRDGQCMAETAQEITEFLEEARQYRAERSIQLKKTGFSNTPEGMNKVCEQFGTSEHQEDWQELLELVERCKTLNLENGATLKILQQNTQKQLQRLANRQQRSGYTAHGQSIGSVEPTLRAQA